MDKVKCILLVDDDPITNFLNEELIDDLNIAEHVEIVCSGRDALDYICLEGKFHDVDRSLRPRPNIIFLDINMPLMDGFEFLEVYSTLDVSKKAEIVVIFLTTSDAQKDQLKATNKAEVEDFIEKPLRAEELLKIVGQYFER